MALKMKSEETNQSSVGLNVTLPPSERQKRLLPYMTFYLGQDFNTPKHNYVVQQQKQQQPEIPTKYFKYQPIVDGQKILLEPKTKYTPFLESNALPGPFLPMTTRNNQQQQIEIDKLPNYSAIYDKLSQIKLQQRQNQNAQYVQSEKPNYSSVRTLAYKPKTIAAQNYAPIERPINNYEYQSIKNYPAIKTIVHEQYPVQEPDDQKQYHREEVRKPIIYYRVPKPQTSNKPSIVYVTKQSPSHPVLLQQKPIYVKDEPPPILYERPPQQHILQQQNQYVNYQQQLQYEQVKQMKLFALNFGSWLEC